MKKQMLVAGVFSALLLAFLISAPHTRLNGQTQPASSLVVICGDCPGTYFKLTAERGMLLMKAEGQDAGDLWFYSFTTESRPQLIGRLPAVGKSIIWHQGRDR